MIVVFIGSGNLATQLSLYMHQSGMTIGQVYSRTMSNAKQLAKKLKCSYTNELSEIRTDGDLYVFSLKDTVLEECIAKVPTNKGLWVHTAGSMPMDIFKGYAKRYGVLYPFQTFSKEKKIDLKHVPFFLETACEEDAIELKRIVESLTSEIYFLSSEKRKYIHLSGVFACNFANHMYSLAARILEEQDIPMNSLLPLIDETAAKIHELSPRAAQTGPAVRYDENVMKKHLELLNDSLLRDVYILVSDSIHKEANTNE